MHIISGLIYGLLAAISLMLMGRRQGAVVFAALYIFSVIFLTFVFCVFALTG
jgi:hypothetical protein